MFSWATPVKLGARIDLLDANMFMTSVSLTLAGTKLRRLIGIACVQTAEAIALPILAPMFVHSERRAMTSATS